jgi:hypothetical protein
MTKNIAALFAAGLIAVSLTACGQNKPAEPVIAECDAGDQLELDTDCGYYDDNGNWIWYSWVIPGQTAEGPAPFLVEEKDSHKKKTKKPKASTKPSSKSPATKPAIVPKVSTPAKPVIAPKPKVTTKRK